MTGISSIATPTGLPAFFDSSRPISSARSSHGVGELEQHQAPLGRCRVLPGFEGSSGRVGGAIDVLGIGRLDLGDDLAVGRVLDVERLARGGVHPLAADVLLVGLDALEDVGHRWAS